MSHFYGKTAGGRTWATRCGHKNTGLVSIAASVNGAIRVELENRDGVDYACVRFTSWGYTGRDIPLYVGPVNPTNEQLLEGLRALDAIGLGPLGKQAILAAAAD